MRLLRGNIFHDFSDPMIALIRYIRLVRMEVIKLHNPKLNNVTLESKDEMMELVGIPADVSDHPHQFSGGRSREVAIALVCNRTTADAHYCT